MNDWWYGRWLGSGLGSWLEVMKGLKEMMLDLFM